MRSYCLYPAVSAVLKETLQKFGVNTTDAHYFTEEEIEMARSFDIQEAIDNYNAIHMYNKTHDIPVKF